MIRAITIVLLLSFELFGYCVYVDCTTGVTTATTSTTNSLENKFNSINDKLDEIEDLYSEKEEKLKENNKIYENIIVLKKVYLLRLKEINEELKKQRTIK